MTKKSFIIIYAYNTQLMYQFNRNIQIKNTLKGTSVVTQQLIFINKMNSQAINEKKKKIKNIITNI